MSGAERYVPTKAIRDAVAGREAEVLSALGIQWNRKSGHIRCPYPDHKDEHPSWRWNRDKGRAHCTCTRSASIFDVVAKVKGVDFEGAKIAVAEMVGRSDLIRQRGGKTKATGKSKGRGGIAQPTTLQQRNTPAALSRLTRRPSICRLSFCAH